mgnify:CR=1 FL=1
MKHRILLLVWLWPMVLSAQNWQWVLGFGDGNSDLGYQIVQSGDRIYVAGIFAGSLNLGGTVLTSTGQEDVFIAALDTGGVNTPAQVIWARKFGGTDQDAVFGLEVDANGDLLVTGSFINQCQFTPGFSLQGNLVPTLPPRVGYVAKYRADGTFRWAQRIISLLASTTGVRVESDPSGHVYVLASLEGSEIPTPGLGTGNPTILINNEPLSSALLKYDSIGTPLWVSELPAIESDSLPGQFFNFYFGTDLIDLPNGEIRVLAVKNQAIPRAGGTTVVSAPGGRSNWFDYDPNGQFLDSTLINTGNFAPFALRRTSNGDFAMAGTAIDDFTLSNGQVITAPSSTASGVVGRWSATGQPIWVKLAPGAQEIRSLELDATDAVHVSGFYDDQLTFDSTTIQQTGDNLFLLKTTSSGALEWLIGADNAQTLNATDLALDAIGNVYTTGFFNGNAVFGGDSLNTNGAQDVLVGKLGCSPPPPGPIVGDTVRCLGTSHYAIPSAGPGYGYQWTLSGGGVLTTNAAQATVDWQTPGLYTLTASLTNDCGAGAVRQLVIDVRDAPAKPDISGDSLACLGQRSYLVANSPGVSYQWSLSGGGSGFASGNSFLVNWIALGNQAITVTPNNFCGAGEPDTLAVEVRGLPAQPAPISGNSAICLSTQTYSVPTQPGVSYQWNLSSGGTLLSSGNSATVNWTSAGQHTLSVIPSNPCGVGSARILTVNVSQSPGQPSAITGNQQVCPGPQSYSVNAQSGATYTWTLSGGGALSPSLNSADVQWTIPGTYLLRVTPSNQCGSGPPRTASVTVVATPAQPDSISGLDTVCQGTQVYSLPSQPSVSYTWTLSGGGGLLNPNLNSASIDWNSGGTYLLSVTPSNQCGSGPARSLNVFVRDSTAQVNQITGPNDVCQTLESYVVPDLPGLSYSWSLSSGGLLNAVDTTAFVTWQTPGLHLLSVQTSDGCANALPVQVSAPPDPPSFVSAPDSVCLTTQSYSVLPLPSLSYQWTLSGGGALNSGGPNAQVDWTQTGSYQLAVTAVNQCGASAPAALSVAVADVPGALGLISGADSACLDTALYRVPGLAGTEYQWLLPGGGLLFPDQDSARVLWQTPGTYPLAVRPSNQCGAGPVSTLDVAVVEPPVLSGLQGETLVCLGSQTYQAPAVVGVSYQWSLSGGGSLTPLGDSAVIDWTTPGVYTLEVVPSNLYGTGPTRSLTVKVLDIPAQPSALVGSDSVCPGLSSYSVPLDSNASAYQWSLSGGGTLSNLLNTATVNWTQPGNYLLSVSPQNQCGIGPAQSLSVAVRPQPVQPTPIAGEALPCLGSESYRVLMQTGVDYLWSLSRGGTLTANGSQATVNWTQAGVHTLRVQTENACGTSSPRLLNVEVRQVPDSLTLTVGDSLVCVGNATLYRSSLAQGASYRWSLSGGGSLDTAGNQALVDWATAGAYQLSVRAENACGSGPLSTLTVQVLDLPAQPDLMLRNDTLTALTEAEVQWFLDNVPLDTLANPLLNPTPGQYTAQARNRCGSSFMSQPLLVADSSAVPFRVFIYPNPAQGRGTVEFPPYLGWESIRLVDATGREVAFVTNPDRQVVTLDLAQLAPGIYGVELKTELLTITKKLVLY